MRPRWTFWFDATACSGCKACAVACKDRNGLEVGRFWRRVSEVAGGDWQRQGAAWHHDVFAYHLSIACNHCERPICLEGCPTRAITRRDDGVVLIDETKCMGCGYCSWVCPYSAPQYRDDVGTMSKCTFCVEDLDEGRLPACVDACPVRALDAGDPDQLAARHGPTNGAAGFAPLPAVELTEPALHLVPHADAHRAAEPDASLTPSPARGLREESLVFFTLLSQTAAGVAIASAFTSAAVARLAMPLVVALMIGALTVSFAHLGRRGRAPRAVSNLRASWLSREIVLAGLLTGSAVVATVVPGTGASVATAGIAVLYLAGMIRVYAARTVPPWNVRRTSVDFVANAFVLGASALAAAWVASVADPAGTALAVAAWTGLFGAAVALRRRFYAAYRRVGV